MPVPRARARCQSRRRALRALARLGCVLALLPGLALSGARAARADHGEVCFAETGYCVRGAFADYWAAHGGLVQQGYPISAELREVSLSDGKEYTVQYFERARFEHHPENQPPYDVLLGLLGREQYARRDPEARAAPGGSGELCFEQTGRCVRGAFAAYWLANGGLRQQGLPISDEFDEVSGVDGKVYKAQYFERARFERHPENPEPYTVLLGLLGNERYVTMYDGGSAAPSGRPAPDLPGKTEAIGGLDGQPFAVHVTGARRMGGILPGNGLGGITAPAGGEFIVVFYDAANGGARADRLADNLRLLDGAGRRHAPADDATQTAARLFNRRDPHAGIAAGATGAGVAVYTVPAGAGGFRLSGGR